MYHLKEKNTLTSKHKSLFGRLDTPQPIFGDIKASDCDTEHSRLAAIFNSIRFFFSFSFFFLPLLLRFFFFFSFAWMFLKQCLQQTKAFLDFKKSIKQKKRSLYIEEAYIGIFSLSFIRIPFNLSFCVGFFSLPFLR